MTSRPQTKRASELACDSALFGLEADEERELRELGIDDDTLLDLELAAAEVAFAELSAHPEALEPLPAAVSAKVLQAAAMFVRPVASSGESEPTESPRNVVPLRPATSLPPARDPLRTAGWLVAAAAIALAIAGWARRPERVVITPPVPSTVVASAVDAGPPTADPATLAARQREELLALTGTTRSDWKATPDDAGAKASGDVVWHSGVQKGVMRFAGLAPNDATRSQYQLWIFDETRDDKHPVDGGVFDVGSNGEVLVPISARLKVGKAKLFAVTVEKPGGVVVSKRERIVLTASPPPT